MYKSTVCGAYEEKEKTRVSLYAAIISVKSLCVETKRTTHSIVNVRQTCYHIDAEKRDIRTQRQ
jgi:hypothetical protein